MLTPIRSVLVVDDDPLQLALVESYLGDLGITQILSVGDGNQAIAALTGPEAAELNLIITDVCMPQGDGIDIIKFLADQDLSIPLILMSGSTEELLRSVSVFARTTTVELIGTLAKPFADKDLRALLETGLPQAVASPVPSGNSNQDFALVIDDDPILYETAAAILRRSGFSEVTHAASAAAAKQHLRSSQRIDLIILDLNIPGSDGVEFMNDLRERQSAVTIVIVSAAHASVRNAALHLAKAYGLDIRGAIQKPLTIEKLNQVLK